MTSEVPQRARFRAFALDGALLFFQPATGTSLRVSNQRTAGLRRQAPRVVMFGITNQCNLSCTFCSRDTTRESRWTVPVAASILRDLARAGSLEVAFGGGEPFAFRGFADLIAELHESTALALHVTSNGTLLDRRRLQPFRGLLGQVRVSIYDDPRWRVAAHALAEAGQLWGANVLVDRERLSLLPALLAELATLNCHDISILRYVGEAARQLDASERERLGALISDAPVACRISVCFGDTLPVPRLFDGVGVGADCGAGYDFLTLTPDKRVQSCSFRDSSLPIESALDVLAIWRERRAYLARPSRRVGCARQSALPSLATPLAGPQPPMLWQSFSGNNSGECILLGKFETSEAAQRYLGELASGYAPDEPYSAEWRALFESEQVQLTSTRDDGESWGRAPSSLIAVGRSVLALGYDAGDAFPELRALTWKRAGYVASGGIHLHDSPSLLALIRGRDADDVSALALEATRGAPAFEPHVHGALLFLRLPEATRAPGSVGEAASRLQVLAAGRPLGVEICNDWDEREFLSAKQRLGVEVAALPRLQVWFHGSDSEERARRFAAAVSEGTARAYGSCVLIEGVARRKRLAVLGLRQGGAVTVLDSHRLTVNAFFWFLLPPREKGKPAPKAPDIDLGALASSLTQQIGLQVHTEPGPSWRNGAKARVCTHEPGRALTAMVAEAVRLGAQINVGVSEVDPLALQLRRLIADVSA